MGANESSDLDRVNLFHYNDYLGSDNNSKVPNSQAGLMKGDFLPLSYRNGTTNI